MRHEVADPAEPERGELREDLALVRNAGTKNVIEGRNAVRGDDEQVLTEIVDVADLAASLKRETGELRFANDHKKGRPASFSIRRRGKKARGVQQSAQPITCAG